MSYFFIILASFNFVPTPSTLLTNTGFLYPLKSAEKKPVILTIERFGPAGNILKQDFTIKDPGQRYVIHDPSDPQNKAKDIYVTLQF